MSILIIILNYPFIQDNSLDILYYANYTQRVKKQTGTIPGYRDFKKIMPFRTEHDILSGVECLLIYGINRKTNYPIQEDHN